MKEGVVKKARGPLPTQSKNKALMISAEGFKGPDVYRAIAGRAKFRADDYYDFIVSHCNIDQPDFRSDGHLEIYVSLAAFVCEVYLKSLIFNANAETLFLKYPDGKKRLIDHSLFDLCKKLESLNADGCKYVDLIANGTSDFIGKLKSISNYYNHYRYDFELDEEVIEYTFVFSLMEKLRAVTDEVDYIKSMEIVQKADGSILLS